MKGLWLQMTMEGTKIFKNLKNYGFSPKSVKISGFLSFPVSPHPTPSNFFLLKWSLLDNETIKQIKKWRNLAQPSEIDEILISPYTKCMGVIFHWKFLSSKVSFEAFSRLIIVAGCDSEVFRALWHLYNHFFGPRKNHIFEIFSLSDPLTTERLTFWKKQPHHRHQRGRLPLINT